MLQPRQKQGRHKIVWLQFCSCLRVTHLKSIVCVSGVEPGWGQTEPQISSISTTVISYGETKYRQQLSTSVLNVFSSLLGVGVSAMSPITQPKSKLQQQQLGSMPQPAAACPHSASCSACLSASLSVAGCLSKASLLVKERQACRCSC